MERKRLVEGEICERAKAAGQQYSASAYATVGSGSASVALTVAVDCGGTTTYTNLGSGTASAGSFTNLSGTFTAPTCSNLNSVTIYVEGPPSGVDLIVDDADVH